MAGLCSGSESEDEPLNLNLFARKSFGFQGIPEEKENTLKKIVKQLGATCDNLPKYRFSTVEHFNSLMRNSSTLYNVTFIRDCVDANRCLNIEQYRFDSKYAEKKEFRDFEPCCANFHSGEEACLICDPTLKKDALVKQKRKVKPKPDETLEIKNIDATKKVKLPKVKNIETTKKVKPPEVKNLTSKKVKHQDMCMIDNCSVSSGPHPRHPKKNNGWEPWESRLILDYIICNRVFAWAKSPSLYKRMVSEGFLTHRSPESIRVYFRTSILTSLESYDLPQPIFRKLKRLRFQKGSFPNRTSKEIMAKKARLKKHLKQNQMKKQQKSSNKEL